MATPLAKIEGGKVIPPGLPSRSRLGSGIPRPSQMPQMESPTRSLIGTVKKTATGKIEVNMEDRMAVKEMLEFD